MQRFCPKCQPQGSAPGEKAQISQTNLPDPMGEHNFTTRLTQDLCVHCQAARVLWGGRVPAPCITSSIPQKTQILQVSEPSSGQVCTDVARAGRGVYAATAEHATTRDERSVNATSPGSSAGTTRQHGRPTRIHTSEAELTTSEITPNPNKHPKKPRLCPSRHFPQRPAWQKPTQARRQPSVPLLN